MNKAIPVDGGLRIRQDGGDSWLDGYFPYNTNATINDRGSVRKESFRPGAFSFTIGEGRRIDLLVGHDFGKPLANTANGSLVFDDGPEALRFSARMPSDAPSWTDDALRSVEAGLMTGLSPGYRVPPSRVVPDAEELVPEEGNPGVSIRVYNAVVLREMSLVTNPSFEDAVVDLDVRSEEGLEAVKIKRGKILRWL